MTGKTHVAVAAAASAVILAPESIPMLCCGISYAVAGSMLPDIDVVSSGAGKEAGRFLAGAAAAVVLVVFASRMLGQDLLGTALMKLADTRTGAAFLAMILLCALGILSPHRSFTHSLLGMALFSACAWFMNADCIAYFGIGYGSHLLLDLVNKKGIRLFYPAKKHCAMKLFKADGLADRILFPAAVAVFAIAVSRLPCIRETVSDFSRFVFFCTL